MTKNNTIRELLDKGLTYFGLGYIKQAMEAWNQVLELEPRNKYAKQYIDFVRNNWEPPKNIEDEVIQSDKLEIPPEFADRQTSQPTGTKIGSSSLPSYPRNNELQHPRSTPIEEISGDNPSADSLESRSAESVTVEDRIETTDSPFDGETKNRVVKIDTSLEDQEEDQRTSEAIFSLVDNRLNAEPPVETAPNFDAPRTDPGNETNAWLKDAIEHLEMDDFTNALELSEKVLLKDANHLEALSIKQEAEGSLMSLLSSKLGDLQRTPLVGMKDDEIIWLNLDHQAGFVLSLVDGQMTLDEIISVSNLRQLDVMRILTQLLQDNIIKLT